MKNILVNIIQAFAGLLDGPYRAGAHALAALVQQLDLPEGDSNWQKVTELITEALRDMQAARDLDADTQTQVRLAAERRVHLQLREMGLIARG